MNGNYQIGEKVLGNWTLVKLLGEGSYGKVYEAERVDFGTTYHAAVKIITIPQNQSEIEEATAEGMDEESMTTYFGGFVNELVQEFALMSELKGTANVVSYEDHAVVSHESGIGWDIIIRMELLTPLMERMKSSAMTRNDTVKLGIGICRALELCRRFNIIHRDIKPENIFVSKLGDYKLGDFGIARTVEKTTSGLSKKGTYTYMAPEVYREEQYSANVDIYSLGIVLYRLLNANRAPFLPPYPAPITHSSRDEALRRRLTGEPLPAPKNADPSLAEIVLKACAYDPGERYDDPAQMRRELEAVLHNGADVPLFCSEGDDTPLNTPGRTATAGTDRASEKTTGIFVDVFSASAPEVPEYTFEPEDGRTYSVFASGQAESESLRTDGAAEVVDTAQGKPEDGLSTNSGQEASATPNPGDDDVSGEKTDKKTARKTSETADDKKDKKKGKKILIPVLAALVLLIAAVIIISSVNASKVTMYALDGRTMKVPQRQVADYQAVNWYLYSDYLDKKEELSKPKVVMYAMDGRTAEIPEDKVADYQAVGWYLYDDYLAKQEELSKVTMYALDGRTAKISRDKIEEYQAVGWYLYDDYLAKKESQSKVTMYALDGRTAKISKDKVADYQAVGWYLYDDYLAKKDELSKVTMYALDGRTARIDKEKIAEYQAVGWYLHDDYLAKKEELGKP